MESPDHIKTSPDTPFKNKITNMLYRVASAAGHALSQEQANTIADQIGYYNSSEGKSLLNEEDLAHICIEHILFLQAENATEPSMFSDQFLEENIKNRCWTVQQIIWNILSKQSVYNIFQSDFVVSKEQELSEIADIMEYAQKLKEFFQEDISNPKSIIETEREFLSFCLQEILLVAKGKHGEYQNCPPSSNAEDPHTTPPKEELASQKITEAEVEKALESEQGLQQFLEQHFPLLQKLLEPEILKEVIQGTYEDLQTEDFNFQDCEDICKSIWAQLHLNISFLADSNDIPEDDYTQLMAALEQNIAIPTRAKQEELLNDAGKMPLSPERQQCLQDILEHHDTFAAIHFDADTQETLFFEFAYFLKAEEPLPPDIWQDSTALSQRLLEAIHWLQDYATTPLERTKFTNIYATITENIAQKAKEEAQRNDNNFLQSMNIKPSQNPKESNVPGDLSDSEKQQLQDIFSQNQIFANVTLNTDMMEHISSELKYILAEQNLTFQQWYTDHPIYIEPLLEIIRIFSGDGGIDSNIRQQFKNAETQISKNKKITAHNKFLEKLNIRWNE